MIANTRMARRKRRASMLRKPDQSCQIRDECESPFSLAKSLDMSKMAMLVPSQTYQELHYMLCTHNETRTWSRPGKPVATCEKLLCTERHLRSRMGAERMGRTYQMTCSQLLAGSLIHSSILGVVSLFTCFRREAER